MQFSFPSETALTFSCREDSSPRSAKRLWNRIVQKVKGSQGRRSWNPTLVAKSATRMGHPLFKRHSALRMTGLLVGACRALHRALQILQHFCSVAFRLHFVEDVFDLSIGADDESGARHAHHLFPIHVLFLNHAIGVANGLI